MSHILIGGPRTDYERLRSLLTQWGWTVGSAPALGGGRPLPTVQECDAVVLVGDGAALLGAGPDGAAEPAVPPAPLLLMDAVAADTDVVIVVAGARETVSGLVPGLTACVGLSRELRGGGVGDGRLRDELGHELRSPLTAIKTALELLEGEDADAADPASGGADRRRILAIARRNVQRLHRAVEWSQELLRAAPTDGETEAASEPAAEEILAESCA